MAEALVIHVLHKLADALIQKGVEIYLVSGQIKRMQVELGLIQALLRDADSKRKRDERVKAWVNEVRDMANRIEDAIDTFLDEIDINLPTSSHLSRFFKTLAKYAKNVYKMTNLNSELQNITWELKRIYQLRTDLGITDLHADREENGSQPFRPTKPDDIDDSEVVGLEDDKRKIIEQLLDNNIERRTVLSIVGTGGLGKTTLAQKVYKSADLDGQFYYRTWLSISQEFNLNDIQREILHSIKPKLKHTDPPMTDEDLLVKLKKSLQKKRYLIILDDVWTIDLWERLKIQLPDVNNASRVIITTRSLDVAIAADCNTKPYQLRYLDDKESVALLFRKAFQQHIQPMNYRSDLFVVAQKLTKKCGGLPLALVVLGGILSRRDRHYTTWNRVEETMNWHNEDGMKCSQVLAMSYEDLPHHLKPCFRYFSSFPEDYVISGKHVIRMWLAEGFIPKSGEGTIDDRAEEFLQELGQRCLIQVTERSWNGYCKTCRMHDLLRDLAIREAEEENFFTVFTNTKDGNQLAAQRPRRVALQFCSPTEDGVYSENTRSLVCFGFRKNSSNDTIFGPPNFTGFRLLRVLSLERVDMTKFACGEWLQGLIHLRYLGLRYCIIRQKIFSKNLYNLETIDLKGSRIHRSYHPNDQQTSDWSDVVIPTLRHVYGPRNLERICPLKWGSLTNLETLKSVGQGEVPRLGCSTKNMRTLGIHYGQNQDDFPRLDSQKEWATLKDVLEMTKQLVSLSIVTSRDHEILLPFGAGGTKDLPCHKKIQSLHLEGKWRDVPIVEMFPTYLTKLTLVSSGLQEDPMPIFEKLLCLRILRLRYNSYEGTKMICSTGGFPSLEKLELSYLEKLNHWDIKEGAMPILSHLKIDFCRKLRTLPVLQKEGSLRELLLNFPSNELQAFIEGEEGQCKFQHIPFVRITRVDLDYLQ